MRITQIALSLLTTITLVVIAHDTPACALICLQDQVVKQIAIDPTFDITNQESLCDIPTAISGLNLCLKQACSPTEEQISREMEYEICGDKAPIDPTMTAHLGHATSTPSTNATASLTKTAPLTTRMSQPSAISLPDPNQLLSFVESAFSANGITEFPGMVQPTAAPVAKASAGSRYETSAVAVLSAVAAFVMNW